jgi:hypothetical protein
MEAMEGIDSGEDMNPRSPIQGQKEDELMLQLRRISISQVMLTID